MSERTRTDPAMTRTVTRAGDVRVAAAQGVLMLPSRWSPWFVQLHVSREHASDAAGYRLRRKRQAADDRIRARQWRQGGEDRHARGCRVQPG